MKFEICGFEHLHVHTNQGSLLDGFASVNELCSRAKKINQQFITVSDHGMMSAVPSQIRETEDHGLTPIFGCELYCNPMQESCPTKESLEEFQSHLDEDQKRRWRKSYHLLALAYNDIGYRNLVKLVSWGFSNGYGGLPRRPRVNHEVLMTYKEGIMFSSCCYMGEIGQAFDRGGEELAFEALEKYIAMFSPNFVLEAMMLDFKAQKPFDQFLIKAHLKYGVPLILSQDCHYAAPEDSKYQRYMLMVRTKRTIQDIEEAIKNDADTDQFFELQDQNLWLKSEDELNEKWLKDYQEIIPYELFCQAKRETVRVANKCKGVSLDRSIKLPQIDGADEQFKQLLFEGFKQRGLSGKRYMMRLQEEYDLICRKGFSSYFIIQKQMIDEARRVCPIMLGIDGSNAVGPARGCLSPLTRICMTDGVTKPICEVQHGDKVITIDGSSKVVKEVLSYDIKDEELLNISCYYGDSDGVTLTKDHKIWCQKVKRPKGWEKWADSTKRARRRYEEPSDRFSWLPASKLEVGDWVFVPKPKGQLNWKPMFDLSKLSDGLRLTYDDDSAYHNVINGLTKRINKIKKCPRFIEWDETWMQILGMFAGDGWLLNSSKNSVGFCFHKQDKQGIEFLLKSLNNKGFNDIRVSVCRDAQLTQVCVKNAYLYELFSHLYCDYQSTPHTKHVPLLVKDAPHNYIVAFLRGYHSADGCTHKNKGQFTSVSRRLCDEVRWLCWKVGIPASLGYDSRTDHREEFSGAGSSNYVLIPNEKEITGKQKTKRYVYRDKPHGLYLQIRKIKHVRNVSKVYDLSVDDNHNYMTSSFLVHNSSAGSLACYCLGITDVDPIRHDLLFSRFISEARGGKQIKLKFSEKIIAEVEGQRLTEIK